MKIHPKLRAALILILWIGVWQLASMAVGSELLLPSPTAAIGSLFHLVGETSFWQSVGMTLARVTGGFLSGLAVGTLLGALTARSSLADAFFSPISALIKATPVTSFIILLLLWFSASATPTISAFLMVMPIFWSNVREGILSTDKQLLEMAQTYKFTRWMRVKRIYAPSLLPQFIAACTTGIGFAWKSGVAAEVIASPAFSVGRGIYNSKIYLEIPDLFAWTLAVVALSMLFERLILRLIKTRLFRKTNRSPKRVRRNSV